MNENKASSPTSQSPQTDHPLNQHDAIQQETLVRNGKRPIVSVQGLNKAYGSRIILKSVSCDFYRGQIVVIVGRSGSGKSTLLRTIAGLTELDDGTITIDNELVCDGDESTDQWDEQRRKIGMIFQSYTLWPHLSVYKNLALAPRKVLKLSESDIRAQAQRSLEAVGMEQYIDSMPSTLSGGQRQRVAIARALMMNPQVLLCDEITSALDPPVAADVLAVLTKLKERQNMAIILVTHDMSFAARAADKVLFFSAGEITTYGSFNDARNHRENKELQTFINAITVS
ncbi:amino acid ABC transporter ATP-binding protein [Bifidobacterium aquikefiri]|uniref:Glutamine transport ATP-binding protein GlnQ n=1 Tax=Bifidobacterium aquikefiri TaxID=1653207 RepID=A0A261GA82_9BIFI|nr:amino acid ABC transporter ATP-binding protein [Bifidobacterium aquikefiri]OZG67886.1 Glutamine transport ATP-binding protein GlnQ [Bifidobacterium aquikefiri]